MFIDTHCHLDAPPLAGRLASVIAEARQAGVGKYFVPGVSPAGWGEIAAMAKAWEEVLPAFGLHPMHAELYSEEVLEQLANFSRGGAAIGEIGLDYLLAGVSRTKQLAAFRDQLRLAVTTGLPVLIHCRRAFPDLLQILREEEVARVGGVLHAFSGSVETAVECIRLGLQIGVAGTVTYRNAVRPLALVSSIPLEHLLLETDAPDMTPEPYRGKSNEPALLVETAKKVAAIKGVSLEEVAAVTTANAERLFRL